ncbi:hypothetical protein EV424DRAFT_1349286 [Suillus variegatus]|nr:hypothetical protein EV424DRAFT_1349286 [Suillus variegatus]
MSKLLLPFASPSAKMMFDTGYTGAGSYFGMPGDNDTDKIRAVQSSIPGGDAIDAGDIVLNNSVTASLVEGRQDWAEKDDGDGHTRNGRQKRTFNRWRRERAAKGMDG